MIIRHKAWGDIGKKAGQDGHKGTVRKAYTTQPASAGPVCEHCGRLLVLLAHPGAHPLKIFVVFIHEASHALATVLTGGRVVSMVVTPWESGYVQSVGGSPC